MRELLLRVTAKDCRWDYFKGSGPGGQKKQKTSSGVRCTHPPSGAVGVATDTRSQKKNKQLAFRRMAESETFQKWMRIESARKTGALAAAEQYAEREIRNTDHIRVEVKQGKKWVEANEEISN